MDVVIVLVFISLILVIFALLFFLGRLRGGDFDHAERLSLLPLAEDDGRVTASGAGARALASSPAACAAGGNNSTSRDGTAGEEDLPIESSADGSENPNQAKEEGSPHGSQ